MLDLRKLFLAFAVLLIASAPALAQLPLNCIAQAAGTPSIRAEGVTELVGDVLVICSGGVAKAWNENLDQVNIQVFSSPSINITSRRLASVGTGDFTEALLFIDEPTPAKQTACGSTAYPYSVPFGSGQPVISGVCGAHRGSGTAPGFPPGLGTYDPDVPMVGGTRGNAYQARASGANSLIWQGVPIDPPGTTGSRILRITNVRVNASQLGVPSGAQASVSLVVSTSASGVGNPIALPITNPAPTVAIAQNSLSFSVRSARTGGDSCLQCESANKSFLDDNTRSLGHGGAGNCNTAPVRLRFEELFPSAFRRRNTAQPSPALTGDTPPAPISQDLLGFPFQTETGFYKDTPSGTRWNSPIANGTVSAGAAAGTLGLADHGTRLIARFTNVQSGLQIWVQTTVSVYTTQAAADVRTGTARLITTDPNGAGPFSATPAGASPANLPTVLGDGLGIAQVSIIGGTGQAVWELVNTDTTTLERVEPRVVIAYAANTANNLPSFGTSSVSGNLAPISTVSGGSFTAPLPRFVDTAVSRSLVNINPCRTNLLFPFVTNQGGFDTGLAISNTSKDPFGTAVQTGACTINYYGVVGASNVTLAFPSPSITGGEHFVWSLSSGGAVQATAGFQGYIIAQCAFQYGHGYAFISDLGARNLAQGYIALVMDKGIDSRTGSSSEVLSH